MSRKILSEKPISLERVRDLLRYRGESAELNYIQRVTLEYAQKFSKHFPNSEEMLDILNERFEISRDKGIQLINMNPKEVEELQLVLDEKYTEDIKNEIIALFQEHLSLFDVEAEEESEDEEEPSTFETEQIEEDPSEEQ